MARTSIFSGVQRVLAGIRLRFAEVTQQQTKLARERLRLGIANVGFWVLAACGGLWWLARAGRDALDLPTVCVIGITAFTSDNGTEFHWYGQVEAVSAVKFYFATPHHSWERGTNENTNGLIRQYLPKGRTMKGVTQNKCDKIAEQLNTRPRKRHAYKTPNQCFLRY